MEGRSLRKQSVVFALPGTPRSVVGHAGRHGRREDPSAQMETFDALVRTALGSLCV